MENLKTDTMEMTPVAKPRIAIFLISLLAAFQVVRIFALPIIQGVFDGKYSEAWLYPAMVDMVIGASALVIGYALWKKRGLAVWTIAIVWFVISVFDHMDAFTVIATTTEALPPGFPPQASSAMAGLLVMSALELLALVTLTRSKLRNYYLGR